MIFAADCRPESSRLAVKGMIILLLSMLLAALLIDLDPDPGSGEIGPLLTSKQSTLTHSPRPESGDEEGMPPACRFAARAGQAGMVRIPARSPACHGT